MFDLSETRLLTRRSLDPENAIAQEQAGHIGEPARYFDYGYRAEHGRIVFRVGNATNPLDLQGRGVRLTLFQNRIGAIWNGLRRLVAAAGLRRGRRNQRTGDRRA